MANVLGTILAFTIVFGILVFVHEFGHFFMAKLVGVRVEVFSFGYGKRLFGVKRGETDYRISLLPLGGYVKLLGEGMFEKDRPLAPDDLMAKTRGQRLLIMAMGSIMNIILAVLIVAFMNVVGTEVAAYLDDKPVIGYIETGSPAEKAGMRIDDEIVRISGRAVKTWTRRRDGRRHQARPARPDRHPQGRRDPAGRPADGIGDPVPDGLCRLRGQDLDPDQDGPVQVGGREGRPQGRGHRPVHRRRPRLL